MSINGFYPISVATVVGLSWTLHLDPLVLLALVALVWANVAIHEMGHAAAVRWTGGGVTRISIWPGYGVTSLQQPNRLAFAIIALAGPAAGLAGGATALFVLGHLSGPSVATAFGISLRVVLCAGTCDNLFNLVPVGLLDGGQFVKAIREWRSQHRPMAPARGIRPMPVTEVRYSHAA